MADAKGKNSIVAQFSWLEDYSELSDEQFGQLMRAYLKYGKTKEPTKFSSALMRLAFNQLRRFADYTTSKYDELCKRRAEYGKKRGQGTKQEEAKASISKHKQAKASISDHYDNDIDNDIDNDNEVVVVNNNDNDIDVPLLGTVKDYFHNNNYHSDPVLFFQYNAARSWNGLKGSTTWQNLADLWESREKEKTRGGDPGDIGFDW